MIVQATRVATFEISTYHQQQDDPDDGMRAGHYAMVGPPGEQSDFAVGPCKTPTLARAAAVRRLERMGYQVQIA